jgi:hypothetical protein
MAASALTPTSAITRFMLQASTLIAISVDTLGFTSGSALRSSSIRELFAYLTIYRVVKWLTNRMRRPMDSRQAAEAAFHEASGTPGEATIPPECQSAGLSSHRSGCSEILKNPVLAGRIGSTKH